MRYGSICSGIEAATVAWHPLGWEPAWFSEIASFPSALLDHYYPTVPNLGDMTKLANMIERREIEAPDIICGGTPCQAFSISGNRQSLGDDRGNLSLVFCEVCNAVDDVRHDRGEQPAIIMWENVPGVLSTFDNAFGCFLAGLAGESEPVNAPNGRWPTAGIIVGTRRSVTWRVLDAQYFGLAQRRKRVFVVASARTDIDIGQVLTQFDGVQRHTAPSRKSRQDNTKSVACDGVRIASDQDTVPTLTSYMGTGGNNVPLINVRRLTPRECERLQGFPDDYTLIPYKGKDASDAVRYHALGNSWAVSVVRWIGRRIVEVVP